MADFVQNIVDDIIDQYMSANDTKCPWIIGFNDGKVSTVMPQLLEQVKHFHVFVGCDIYVVCNDTIVENSVVTEYVYHMLDKIEITAHDKGKKINQLNIKSLVNYE
jgi:DNA sulfur modification protein DndC